MDYSFALLSMAENNNLLYFSLNECKPLLKNLKYAVPSEYKIFELNKQKRLTIPRYADLVKPYLILDLFEDLDIFELFPLITICNVKMSDVESKYNSHTLLLYYITKRLNLNKCHCYNKDYVPIYRYTIEIPLGITNEYIPIIALQYVTQDIHVETNLKTTNVVKYFSSTCGDIKMNRIWKQLPRELAKKIIGYYDDIIKLYSHKLRDIHVPRIGCDYIFLERNNRGFVAQTQHKFRWEHINICGKGTTNSNIILYRTNVLQYIIFFIHSGEYFNPREFKQKIDPVIDVKMKISTTEYDSYTNTYDDINFMRIIKPKEILSTELPIGMYMIPFCSSYGGFLSLHSIHLQVNSPDKYNVTICGLNLNRVVFGNGSCGFSFGYSF